MTEQMTEYRWPDLSPVERQYIVKDDMGRYGVAVSDPVYHPNVLFIHPIDTPNVFKQDHAIYITHTAWIGQSDGSYAGVWYDYSGPELIPAEQMRRVKIVSDLGYRLPDTQAARLLSGLAANQPSKTDMTIDEAMTFARDAGEPVTERGIRYAAAEGFIPGARKKGRDWLIPYEGFDYYLDHRPKPGRKTH